MQQKAVTQQQYNDNTGRSYFLWCIAIKSVMNFKGHMTKAGER